MSDKRRHLTQSQREAVAAEIANLGEGRLSKTSSIELVSQPAAAKLMGVSVSSVQRAAELKRADPLLHEQVKARAQVMLESTLQCLVRSSRRPGTRLVSQRRIVSRADPLTGPYRVLPGVAPVISQHIHRLKFIARTEEAIGGGEQAITQQLVLIGTLTTNWQAATGAWELLRVMEEHLAELHVKRQLLLDVSRIERRRDRPPSDLYACPP